MISTTSTIEKDTSIDPVEAVLTDALRAAVEAGRFDVVSQLAEELKARRMASATNVVSITKGRASK